EHDQYIANYLKTGEAKILGIGREVVGLHKNGATIPLELTVSKIDHLRLFTGIMRDISQRKSLQKQLLTIGAKEQRRIGQDLHDGIGQEVMALGITANTLVEALEEQASAPSGASAVNAGGETLVLATRVATGLKQTLTQVRALSKGLVPVEVDAEGLMSALEDLTAQISQLHGISCAFECVEPVPIEDNQTATHLYRITQEAVTNAIKHAQTHDIRVTLETDPEAITLKIQDDGIGMPDKAQRKDGIGLRIMQYRNDLIGGMLTVERIEKSGTLVKCILRNDTQYD
ncbi:MAG: PAS domain-containing sensor histidine kinase, partial [Pirellulaceae bacterium]